MAVLLIIYYILSWKHNVSKDILKYWEKGTCFFWVFGDTGGVLWGYCLGLCERNNQLVLFEPVKGWKPKRCSERINIYVYAMWETEKGLRKIVLCWHGNILTYTTCSSDETPTDVTNIFKYLKGLIFLVVHAHVTHSQIWHP